MALLTALVFLALAATCQTLALDFGDEHRCPCKKEHKKSFIEKKELVYTGKDGKPKDYRKFGIGCRVHTRDQEFAERIYGHEAAAQLRCYDDPKARDPWCESRWCYIDKNCSLDWTHGRLGRFSHATCRNLKQGWPEYAIKSLAASLSDDPLRVLHLENTLDRGYMGNSHCKEDQSASGPSRVSCGDSLLAAFWRRSLESLASFKVIVEPVLIKKSDGIDDHFNNITGSFDEYMKHYSEQGAMKFPTNPTNFDICAFATGLGWVDLCSGTVALTHLRQEMTYLIELYTTSAFMVSKSTCTLKKPFWWFEVFSWGAWIFFGAMVFILTVFMYVFDDVFAKDCIDHTPTKCSWPACRRACYYAVHSLFTCVRAIGEALTKGKPKSIHHAEGQKRSRASWCVRQGLSLFIFVTSTLYASSLTFELIAGRENGQYPSLAEAEKNTSGVTVCLHKVYQTSMKPYHENPNSNINPTYFTDWEELREGLEKGTCDAAIVEDEAWNTFRARGELCDFYKPPAPTFYMPTGAPVSRRAYRALETFRFNTSELEAFELGSNKELEDKFQDLCSMKSALCENTGAPWYAFGTLALFAGLFCFVGFLVRVHQKLLCLLVLVYEKWLFCFYGFLALVYRQFIRAIALPQLVHPEPDVENPSAEGPQNRPHTRFVLQHNQYESSEGTESTNTGGNFVRID